MGRPVVYVTLLGLFALVTTLPNKDDWNVYNFHINSTVTGRYATTVIKSRVANRMNESKEIEFHVRIPKNAFITKFRMFIDGQVYDGTVKAKEQAQRQYTEAVSRGESAGLVSSVGRTLEEFKTSVTVAAHKKITFELTYEELMKRTLGKYELQIHARPMQPVQDFKVDVYIHEKAGISFIDVRGGLSTKALANAITKTHVDKQAWVHFYPTEDQQKTCDSCGEQGMNGDLVIVYDVNRDSTLGEIKKSRGYFLHHFAPSELPRVPKNVVFVIDQSGSMHGKKMQQTRLALIQILNDLAEDDHFGLITFDDKIFHWKREMVQATSENIKSAKSFAREIQDRGSTDINKAVLEGTRILNANHKAGSASILILLTDGDPTSGVTNREEILSNVRRAIADKFPLYCLGFGFDVNFEFLEKMSLQNNGVARRIYEDSDADLQLKGFYEEVATPLLVDVAINYSGVTNLTQSNFSIYYNGSEIVVAGQVTDNDIEEFHPQVIAISGNKTVTFSETNTNTEEVSDDQIQRVWAYLTVKQLLQKELVLSGPEKEAVKKEALELSLKYNFVTPLTSMVVTKPPGEDTDVLHKPKEGKPDKRYMQINFGPLGSSPAGLPGMSGFPGRQPGLSVNTKLRLHSSPSLSRRYPQSRPLIPSFHSIRFDEYEDQVFDFETTTYTGSLDLMLPNPTVFQVPLDVWHTFLIQSENQSLPLCFHLKQDSLLKLFHQPSKELYVNGELDSDVSGGFKKIVIHFNNDHHVEVDPKEIIVRVGQTTTHHTEQDIIPAGSVIVIRREKEIDITAGDMRLVIIVHGQMGKEFLWPVLRQQPSDNNTEGILALKPVIYEVIQQTPTTKLKIKDQEIEVKSDFYTDFSVVRPVLVTCWLLPLGSVLQKPIGDFVVAVL